MEEANKSMTSNGCGIEIQKDTFVRLDASGQAEVLYDYLDHIVRQLNRLEKKKNSDIKKSMTISGITGLIGGFLAVLLNPFR